MSESNINELEIAKLYEKKLFVQYSTTNFKNCIRFYTDILGLHPTDFSKNGLDPEKQGIYEFDLPVKGAILSFSKANIDNFSPMDSLVLMVKEIVTLKNYMDSKNVSCSELTNVPNLLSFFTIKDPDGNTIMLMSDPLAKDKKTF